MSAPHDGDVFQLRGGENPLHAEWLDTNGRLGVRIMDKYGSGILLEKDCMVRLVEILHTGLLGL